MGWKFSKVTVVVAMLTGLTVGTSAIAQELEMVEAITDWTVYATEEPKVCFIVSQPTKSEARRNGQTVEVRRGDIRFHISVVPGQGIAGEPSFLAGYPLKPDAAAKLEIGTDSFGFFPDPDIHAEYAWPTPSDDTLVIEAMKRGADAVITAVSARGTTTIDTFSLRGFTAAVDKALELCK